MRLLVSLLIVLLLLYIIFQIPGWIIEIPAKKFGENVTTEDDNNVPSPGILNKSVLIDK